MKRTLLLVGGGHAHIEVLRQLAHNPSNDVDVALFNPSPSTWYGGMLPGVIAGHYEPADAKVNLWALCQRARVRFFDTSALSLNASTCVLESGLRERHRFDIASIDVGGVSSPILSGAGAYVVAEHPVEALLAAISEFESVRSAGLVVRIVGGGIGAVEIALALAHRWRDSASRQISIVAPQRLLNGQPSRVRALVMRACRREGVVVLEHKAVGHIEPTRLRLTNGEVIDTQLTVLATGYAAAPLLEKTDLARAADGSVLINRQLQSSNHPHIFAAGDCAEIVGAALPKSGLWAERQGALLAANLQAYISGKPLQSFVHYRREMNVISLGERRAVISRFGLAVAGGWVWRWKDSLDRKWMQRYALD